MVREGKKRRSERENRQLEGFYLKCCYFKVISCFSGWILRGVRLKRGIKGRDTMTLAIKQPEDKKLS